MATIETFNESAIRIHVTIEDALTMLTEAVGDVPKYARDIVTIFEKMPAFDYTSFCFYAYNTASLFEFMLDMNPKNYTSFSLDAPDAFFYVLYGGMASLQDQAKTAFALVGDVS